MRLFPLVVLIAGLCLSQAPVAHAQDGSAEIEFWQSVKNSESPQELQAYLEAYPQGKFAPLARIRLDALKGRKTSEPADGPSHGPRPHDVADKHTPASAPEEYVVPITLEAPPSDLDLPNRAALGVLVEPLTEGLAALVNVEPLTGVLIVGVVEETPAKKVGLAPGILILELDGVPIPEPATLVHEVGKRRPGDTIQLKIRLITKTRREYEQLLRDGAASGNVDAMVQLAQSLSRGSIKPEGDGEAVRWYKKAADLGHVGSLSLLGRRHVTGLGVPQDDAKAAEYLIEAAGRGDVVAMHVYGWMVSEGRGTKKDKRAAIDWYRKAADAGYPDSMWRLGAAYEGGDGVAKDPAKAVRWYQKAAEHGQEDAVKRLRELGVAEVKPVQGTAAPDLSDLSDDIGDLD